MLRTLALSAVVGLAMGAVACAGERTDASRCWPLAKLRHDMAGLKFTPLTPGQFHFAQGVYVGSPATPRGLPPGDGALLAQTPGEESGVIVWTRGSLACMPLPVPQEFVKLMGAIKTGALDDDGNEL